MIKKISLAILGASFSSVALAGTMGPVCEPGNVTVPCEAKKWDLGVQALYLRTVLDADFGYGNTTSENYKEIDQPWDWGFRLEGSYHYSTGNDITMTWVHRDDDHTQYGFEGVYAVLPGPTILTAPFALKTTDKFDQVNLVKGQHVDMGILKNVRFFGGLQYADIRFDANNEFIGVNIPSPPAPQEVNLATQYHNTDFNGVGPVVGMDASYELRNNFSITMNSAVSILYGTGRYSEGFIFNNSQVNSSTYATKKMIVPSMEAKLGLNYAKPMYNGVLNVEGGYMIMNYFNALQTEGLNPNATVPSTFNNSDYGLYGPYLGLKWVGQA